MHCLLLGTILSGRYCYVHRASKQIVPSINFIAFPSHPFRKQQDGGCAQVLHAKPMFLRAAFCQARPTLQFQPQPRVITWVASVVCTLVLGLSEWTEQMIVLTAAVCGHICSPRPDPSLLKVSRHGSHFQASAQCPLHGCSVCHKTIKMNSHSPRPVFFLCLITITLASICPSKHLVSFSVLLMQEDGIS